MLRSGTMSALYNDDCIYTPDVIVFKSDTQHPELLPQDKWFEADIITCAAPNLKALHTKRANRILDIAKANRAEIVILGAFGCGAFQNPPNVVAAGMYEAVKQHIRDFEAIEFAVYCPPKDSTNYDTFYRQLI